ncbi:MAG TPA: glycosyltransferase family 87 protein [Stellaceae bacterium]|nr:glycosyltransferase family 87 protein [Stellaceae bacterium]
MLIHLIRWALIVAFAAAILLFALISLYSIGLNLAQKNIWSNDFFAIWSFAKFTTTRTAATIYDNAVIHDFQVDLGSSPTYYLPCPYPPSFLLLIAPLGFFSYYAAYAIWIFGTFAFYLIVSIRRQSSRIGAVLFALAPASIVTFASGQTGFLTSALIVGGFRFAAERPILGGILFGLATVKPQLGLLVPVALIAARRWRAAAAACVTALVVVLASGAVLGWQVWPIWLVTLGGHADWAARVGSRYTVTIIGSLGLLGVGLHWARWVQAGVTTLVVILVWLAFRRGTASLAVAAALVGTFLATPYAFIYDMPMATNAAVALLAAERTPGRPLGVVTIAVVGLSLMLPLIIALTWKLSMIRSVPMILLFGLIVWRALNGRGTSSMTAVAPIEKAAFGQ